MAPIEQADRDRRAVRVMGILNVTPDSFFHGGRSEDADAAVALGLEMIGAGADILDIGGESSRPGASPVSTDEELRRVLPVVTRLRAKFNGPLSVDTTKAAVARAALREGADWINDISGLRFDPDMAGVIADAGATVVLMHMQGTPQTMQHAPQYRDIVAEVEAFLLERAVVARAAGIAGERIIIDPGIGFGKTVEHNLTLLRRLSRFAAHGYPVLVGLSRKSFLGAILGVEASERLEATIAANTAAILNGADIIRVHDVREGRRTADLAVRLRT